MELLWYLLRGSGMALLILLTVTTVMGVASTGRWSSPLWPRFLTQQLHRNISIMALALLSIHILTAVADSYVDIRWYEAFWFRSGAYQGAWLWLGTLACDLMILLVSTSLIRARLPLRLWRGIHWLAYLSWAAAVLHGAGIGTDSTTTWGMSTVAVSVGAVAAFSVIRLATRSRERSLA